MSGSTTHQRDAGAVVVDERELGLVDPPDALPCVVLPVSSSMWTRVIPTRFVAPSACSTSRCPPTHTGRSYWLIW